MRSVFEQVLDRGDDADLLLHLTGLGHRRGFVTCEDLKETLGCPANPGDLALGVGGELLRPFPGVARGRGDHLRLDVVQTSEDVYRTAHVIQHDEVLYEDRFVSDKEVRSEVRRFRVAVRRSRDEIQALKECLIVDPQDPGTKILDAHLMILEDQVVLREIVDLIRQESLAADSAVRRVFRAKASTLEAAETDYFRARRRPA